MEARDAGLKTYAEQQRSKKKACSSRCFLRKEEIQGREAVSREGGVVQFEDSLHPSCLGQDQRQQPLESSNGKPSKEEQSKAHFRESSSATSYLPNVLLDELLMEVLRDLSSDVFRSAVKDFVDDYLGRAAIFDSMDDIVTEVVQTILSPLPRETVQEMDCEDILEGIISHVIVEDATALAHSVLGEYDAKLIKLQQHQVTAFASKQLIDIFLLEHLIGTISMQDPGFSGKEHSSVVLASWMFDILIRQFLSIQEVQQTTLENVPLGDFHRKAFTEVALDVILTELNNLAEEDMEDLHRYERGVKAEASFPIHPRPTSSDSRSKYLIVLAATVGQIQTALPPVKRDARNARTL
ncbi:uncharacterized protein LOC106738469 isoform X2 [Alligator mississippiensis]|uniref:uncharacterized protein LOC106738469 isoform X2 n=1 Tax=Alligator mississippiensis TaxID=8496 RepID=UPI0028775606|nr:uncharacterized protein LOC106738469 isoform X2 [Alligator mississippiensis]